MLSQLIIEALLELIDRQGQDLQDQENTIEAQHHQIEHLNSALAAQQVQLEAIRDASRSSWADVNGGTKAEPASCRR